MSSATTLSTPQSEVESLMQQIASENDLDITDQLKELNPTTASIREDGEKKKEDDLSRRYTYDFFRDILHVISIQSELDGRSTCYFNI